MTIEQIIAAADTTSNTWTGELTYPKGHTQSILTFKLRKTAESVALTLKEAGARVHIHRSAYGEYILTATYPTV
jgi:hypothetical protein